MAPVARRKRAPAEKLAYHHGDLRRALIEAAERIVVERGPASLGLREAARAAGVSVAAPYRHFEDKEALLAAVLERGFVALTEAMQLARRSASEPRAQLASIGLAYVRFAAKNPSIYRLMFSPTIDKKKHPALIAAGQAAFGVIVEATSELTTADSRQASLAGWALCHGLASLQTDGVLDLVTASPIEATARAVIEMLFDGILVPAPRARTAKR